MDWTQIITFFIGGGLGGVIAAYIALRKLPGETQRVNIDSAAVASKALIDLLNATQAERVANATERHNLEKRIDAMEAEQEIHRLARNAEIAELKAAHAAQITELQVRITDNGLETQKKIIEVQEQAKAAHRKYRVMKGITQKLVRALQENDPPITIPDLNGDLADLGESALDLPLTHAQREALKGKPH